MAIILCFIGVCSDVAGVYFLRRRQKAAGVGLLAVGGCLFLVGVVALLNFHP